MSPSLPVVLHLSEGQAGTITQLLSTRLRPGVEGGQKLKIFTMQGTHRAGPCTLVPLMHPGLTLASHAVSLTLARLRATAGTALGGPQLRTEALPGQSPTQAGQTFPRTGTHNPQVARVIQTLAAGRPGGCRAEGQAPGSQCSGQQTSGTTLPQMTGICPMSSRLGRSLSQASW